MTTDKYMYGLSENTSEALGELVKLVKIESAEVIGEYRLRVHFDRAMKKNNALSNPTYYSIDTPSPGSVTPYISDVIVPDIFNPTYVDLITSEMTGGENYYITVNAQGPIGIDDLRVDEYYNSQSFVSIAVNPTIKDVIAISETRIDIIFSENMKYNEAIIDKDRYAVDNGLEILTVLEAQGDTVKLVTSPQISGILYTLTIV